MAILAFSKANINIYNKWKVNDFADKIYVKLKLKGYQVEFDKSPATLQKKVRNSQLAQFNYILFIG